MPVVFTQTKNKPVEAGVPRDQRAVADLWIQRRHGP